MHSPKLKTLAVIALTCTSLSACNFIPSSGPSASSIASISKKSVAPYVLIKVTQAVADMLAESDQRSLTVAFGGARQQSVSRIGVGDSLAVSIWEASDSGLFSSGSGKQGGTLIPEQPVSETGAIVVPYAGLIRVVGLTPQQVKAQIEKNLAGKAVEPQVLVNVVKNNANAVTVTGEVAASGRIPLVVGGERLLDVIAAAGGPRREAHLLAVQITRGMQTQVVPLEDVISDPRENVYVHPNDIVTVIRQPRTFTVFGASNVNASYQFDESQLYLNQALAKAGGLNDDRANAKGVFIYRREPVQLIRRVAPNAPAMDPAGMVNVIFQIDLQDPVGFFVLKSFKVQNRDLIYIANSSLAEIRKFSSLIATTVSPAVQGANVATKVTSLTD